jgi:hypothetical protein
MFETMDAPPRGALMFVRFVAVMLVGVGLLDVGLYLVQCFQPNHPLPVKILPLVLDSIPFWVGAVALVKARAIAEWIENRFD